MIMNYVAATAVGASGNSVEPDAEGSAPPAFARLLPHFTPTLVPSTSKPLAHASAACSADGRSMKLMNAQRDFGTCTTERIVVVGEDEDGGSGSEITTAVRMEASVALGGRAERKIDVCRKNN